MEARNELECKSNKLIYASSCHLMVGNKNICIFLLDITDDMAIPTNRIKNEREARTRLEIEAFVKR